MIPQMLFSPNGAKLYELCLWDGSYPLKPGPLLRVVDLKKRAFLGTLRLPKSHVAALAPDGRNLAKRLGRHVQAVAHASALDHHVVGAASPDRPCH